MRSIAVLTPYRGQVRLNTRRLTDFFLDKARIGPLPQQTALRGTAHLTASRRTQHTTTQVRAMERAVRRLGADWPAPGVDVAISSVDAYQGREADAVVFSAVRCVIRVLVGVCVA